MQMKGDVIIKTILKKNEIIPMTFDLMFTEIFNNEKNIDLLEEFISYYMEIPINFVKGNLILLSRNLKKKNLKSSKKEVDLLLDLNGKKYNIELSNKWNQGIIDRNVLYLSNIHGEQLKSGFTDYNEIEESIQINLNNFDSEEDVKTSYYYTNDKGKILSKKCRIDVINLEKGSKMSYTDDERLNKLIDWCKLFKSTTEEELKRYSKKVLSNNSATKLVSEVKRLSGDDEMIDVFDMNNKRDLELKCIYDEMYENKLNERLEKELEKEKEKLKQQGIQKGIEEGIEQGSHQEKISIAKNLLELNMPINDVSKVTGLSKEEIEKLK